jgi:hypothetical protein
VRQDRPSVGFDPDLALVDPAPPSPYAINSLKLWLPDHPTPLLTFELVSTHHPTKDYVEVPDQCAAAGVFELVIFDPVRSGPRAHGGPLLLQVWRRAEDGGFERVDAGDAPARSVVLGAWLVPDERERLLVISDDPAGERPWPTGVDVERAHTEAERAAKEAERAAKEAERAGKEAALQRVAELEGELAKRSPR